MIGAILFAIATESIVNLLFNAAPLQGAREWIIRKTPALYSSRMESHLLECKYCTSVWVGIFLSFTLYFLWCDFVGILCAGLVFHRLSNFIHLTFGYVRDAQIDRRINRNKR
jgi:hypothetical protein